MADAARTQLRMYQIEPGRMGEFLESFRGVVTARSAYGFIIEGAWVVDGEDRFVWLTTYEGDGDWDEAVERYYHSPERQALDPDPDLHRVDGHDDGAPRALSVSRRAPSRPAAR